MGYADQNRSLLLAPRTRSIHMKLLPRQDVFASGVIGLTVASA